MTKVSIYVYIQLHNIDGRGHVANQEIFFRRACAHAALVVGMNGASIQSLRFGFICLSPVSFRSLFLQLEAVGEFVVSSNENRGGPWSDIEVLSKRIGASAEWRELENRRWIEVESARV